MRQNAPKRSPTSANGQSHSNDLDPLTRLPPDTLGFLSLSLKKQWKRYRKCLKKCQRKFSERSVHDLRIAARRLLSVLDLLSPFVAAGRRQKAQAVLKRHLDTFDDLRDVQVQLPAVRQFRRQFPAADCFYRFLKKQERRLRRCTCKKATKLRSKRLSKLLSGGREDVQRWLEQGSSRQANRLLLHAVNLAFVLTQKRKDSIEPDDTHSIHCTRIAFKKFRYVVEALQDRLPWANELLLTKMHDYQTSMGNIQDAEVLLRRFQKFVRKEHPDKASSLRFERVLQQHREWLIGKYLATADQLLEFWPVWRRRARSEPPARNGRSKEPAGRQHTGYGRSVSKKKTV